MSSAIAAQYSRPHHDRLEPPEGISYHPEAPRTGPVHLEPPRGASYRARASRAARRHLAPPEVTHPRQGIACRPKASRTTPGHFVPSQGISRPTSYRPGSCAARVLVPPPAGCCRVRGVSPLQRRLSFSVKVRHASAGKARAGPSGCLESLTAMMPESAATSTHSPPLSVLRLALRHEALIRSIVVLPFFGSVLGIGSPGEPGTGSPRKIW